MKLYITKHPRERLNIRWSHRKGAIRVAARGLALRGPFFEDPLLDELSVRGYENYALLLSVGISGAERASSA